MMNNREKQRNMEQRIEEWSEKELKVAQILVELPLVWADRASFAWGRTRMRSAIEESPYLSSSPSRRGGGSHAAVAKAKNDAVASPASPLSLSHTESDEKLKTKPSLIRRKESYLRRIQDLTKIKQSLNQELDNVKRHCTQLKDFNLMLRARKQKLSNNGGSETESENPNLENGKSMQLEHGVNSDNEQEEKNNRPRCEPSTTSLAVPSSSSSSSLGRVSANEGPLKALPDLKLTVHVDSWQPLDKTTTMASSEPFDSSSKAMAAAQARQRRLQICRLNKMKRSIGSSSKSRFSDR